MFPPYVGLFNRSFSQSTNIYLAPTAKAQGSVLPTLGNNTVSQVALLTPSEGKTAQPTNTRHKSGQTSLVPYSSL